MVGEVGATAMVGVIGEGGSVLDNSLIIVAIVGGLIAAVGGALEKVRHAGLGQSVAPRFFQCLFLVLLFKKGKKHKNSFDRKYYNLSHTVYTV